jgi:hypothetical protein
MGQQPSHSHHAPHHHPHRFISHHQALVRQENELASLHPVFLAKIRFVLVSLQQKSWQPFVYQGKTRTPQQAQQNAKKGTGITKSWHRPDVEGHLVSTNEVVQLYAADIVDERWGWEGPAKDLNHQFWKDLGGFAQAAGLEWGGNWKKRDVAHVQMALVDAPPERLWTV